MFHVRAVSRTQHSIALTGDSAYFAKAKNSSFLWGFPLVWQKRMILLSFLQQKLASSCYLGYTTHLSRGLLIPAGCIFLLQERHCSPCCCCVAELSVLIFNWEERGRDTIMSIIGTRYKYHQYTAQAPMLATLQQDDAHSMLNVSPYQSVINQSEL